MNEDPAPFSLRSLSLPARLVIAAFLISVGIGYFSALVQLHFQHASPGKLLPDADDAVDVYHGRAAISQLERVLLMDEGKPFNGSGSMRQGFTTKSAGWKSAISRRAKEKRCTLRQAEEQLRAERNGERLALFDWIRTGSSRESFEADNHVLSASLVKHPITAEFVEASTDGTTRVKVAAIFEARCARCHGEGKGGAAEQVPLETWEQIHEYSEVETRDSGMSMQKLAQTTHIHLLGFAMLYSLTGLVLAATSYPAWVRLLLGPLPLVAQVLDIGCWWLARTDPVYAQMIVFTGSLVALGLFLQISLSLFNLFGRAGKIALAVLMLAGALGGYVVKETVIEPYLARERLSTTVPG